MYADKDSDLIALIAYSSTHSIRHAYGTCTVEPTMTTTTTDRPECLFCNQYTKR